MNVDDRKRLSFPWVTKLRYIMLQIVDSNSESSQFPQLSHALRGSTSV